MNRPKLSPSLDAAQFTRWYWLKAELVEFCRELQIPVSGSKQDLAARVEAHLAGQKSPHSPAARKPASLMPARFTLASVIGPNWRCSQSLRGFFEKQVGPGFKFNAAMREFISQREGSTLEEALQHYKRSLQTPKTAISEQFEYNRHMRDFHASNPGATQSEAVSAWWARRGRADE